MAGGSLSRATIFLTMALGLRVDAAWRIIRHDPVAKNITQPLCRNDKIANGKNDFLHIKQARVGYDSIRASFRE